MIAHALLKEPSILILDKTISAVGNETEAAIQKSLATKNRLTIAIALLLFRSYRCDRFYAVRQGETVT